MTHGAKIAPFERPLDVSNWNSDGAAGARVQATGNEQSPSEASALPF